MFHPCTKAVSRVSYRGQKGIPCIYCVSPQQAETGQLLQHPEPADPGGGSSLCRLKIGWPVVCSKPTFPIWLNIPLSKSSAFFKPLSICETLAVGMAIITP